MIKIANPIYDSVFKYLIDDERVAKTLLSALLRKEVVEVEQRPHEYVNGVRDNISMFRIDFAARVRKDDGTTSLVLIELQKTWLETETLRFRQYLGAQYSNPDNMETTDKGRKAGIPMVAVYLLGHRVGDIEEPVLYVSHKSYTYDNREVTKGLPNPFIDSLTHDSIIVQIPLLRGQVNNRLDKVLSVFDQTSLAGRNSQMLTINEAQYEDDTEMRHILERLERATFDAKIRQDMNVEDEFFSAIENRDTEIMALDRKIAEQKVDIAEKESQIAEKEVTIAKQRAAMRMIINNMLDNGQSIEDVAVIMGLSIDEIRNIKDLS